MKVKHPFSHLIYQVPGPVIGTAALVGDPPSSLLGFPGVDQWHSSKLGFYGHTLPMSTVKMGQRGGTLYDYEEEPISKPPLGNIKLHGYQRRIVSFLRQLTDEDEGAIIGIDPGLGKTLISLHFLWLEGLLQEPGLVIGPNLARPTWIDKDSDALSYYSLKLPALDGVKSINPLVLNTWKWFYCHFEILHAWQGFILDILKPRWLIIDEIHYLANANSRISKCARQLSAAAHIRRRIGLTGTPIPNTRLELWAQLAVVQPRQWGRNRHDFGVRYCAGYMKDETEGGFWDYSGESNTQELRYVLAGSFLRVTQAEIPKGTIPEIKRHVIEIKDLDGKLLEEYSLAQCDFRAYLKSKDSFKGKKSQTVKIGDQVVEIKSGPGREQMVTCLGALISILSKIKRKPALQEIAGLMKKHTRLVVFSWHTETCKWLYKEIKAATPLIDSLSGRRGLKVFGPATSHIKMERRKELAVEFASTDYAVYVCTLGAVGTSINPLAAADAGLQVELIWNTVRLIQGERRIQREGCPWPIVNMYYLICRNTVDDVFMKKLQEKASVTTEVAPDDHESNNLVSDLSPAYDGEKGDLAAVCKALADTSIDADWY